MNRYKHVILFLMMLVVALPANALSTGIADYLILQDIGLFKLSKPEKFLAGEPPIGGPKNYDGAAVVSGAGHLRDHADVTYEVKYYDFTKAYPSPTVQITPHVGGDSDKWLLHEIEDPFRDSEQATLGQLTDGTVLRRVNGNRVFWIGIGGGSFVWLSNNVTVKLSYTDMQGLKPEPQEVINAYLQKYPSTLPATLTLNGAHDVQWIKDELERRLWLSDKWVAQITDADPKLGEKLGEIAKHLGVFLDYREKYYSGSAEEEKFQLDEYARKLDKENLLKKQAEYKQWWLDNKGLSFVLSTMYVTHTIKYWWQKLLHTIMKLFRQKPGG